MQHKQVLFIANSLDNAHKFQQVLSLLDVRVSAGSSAQFKHLLQENNQCDLVVYELSESTVHDAAKIGQTLHEQSSASLLLIVSEAYLPHLTFPTDLTNDFVVGNASSEECSVRIQKLLRNQGKKEATDKIVIDAMTIDLATYQVTINNEPVDLTYLEYALLSFLAAHPNKTHTRDALLRKVWGFDYYGGSRTVDVHIRRLRAKLGPDLAQHLETVRGVGYLWSR